MKDIKEENIKDNHYCAGCSKDLPSDAFNKDRCRRSGLQSQCRACKRSAQRRDYQAKKSLYLDRQRRARAANPLRKRAYELVGLAIKRGDLTRPRECPECGRSDQRIEAHHHKGYEFENALNVVFVCTSCHRAAESD